MENGYKILWTDFALEELSTLTKNALIKKIEEEKSKEKPFINSQIVVSDLLTEFGKNHSFHRQFREKHPNSDSGQILGMSYIILCFKMMKYGHIINQKKVDICFLIPLISNKAKITKIV